MTRRYVRLSTQPNQTEHRFIFHVVLAPPLRLKTHEALVSACFVTQCSQIEEEMAAMALVSSSALCRVTVAALFAHLHVAFSGSASRHTQIRRGKCANVPNAGALSLHSLTPPHRRSCSECGLKLDVKSGLPVMLHFQSHVTLCSASNPIPSCCFPSPSLLLLLLLCPCSRQ